MGRVFLVAQSAGLRAAISQAIRDQGAGALEVVGEAGAPCELMMLQAARPDVVVLVLGFEPVIELDMIPEIHHFAPDTRLVAVDTLGNAHIWLGDRWDQIDALLSSEHLSTELVPVIQRLAAQRCDSSSKGDEQHTISAV